MFEAELICKNSTDTTPNKTHLPKIGIKMEKLDNFEKKKKHINQRLIKFICIKVE